MNKEVEQFTIEVSSDLNYEKMVVNLLYGYNQVAILSCEKGINHIEIEILDKYRTETMWKFDYQSFSEALNLAIQKLQKVNR